MSYHFAQPGWESTLLAGQSLVPLLPLDELEADRAAAIFDRLHLPDVPGQPTLGEAAGDWFRDVVRAVFGSIDEATGIRQVPGVFLLVPKKNSKTTNGAALMLTALLMNERPNAAFALFGPTQEIADLAFAAVSGMVAADKDLDTLLHVRDHLKTVVNRVTGATLKVMTFDMKVATGGKYAGWLLDELHLLGKVAYTSRVIGQLRGARVAIPEAFGIIITTQSDEPPAGAFKAELDYARSVRDGRIENATILPVLYEFPEAMQTDPAKPWRQVENWARVLPNLGRSVSLPVLTQDYATAREMGDEEERRWASQHLNIQIGLALHSNRWEGADHWERAGSEKVTLEFILAECDVCTVGIDGGGLDDLLGLAVLGRHRVTKRWYHWGHAWADRGVLLLRKEIASRLLDFEREGDLTFVDIAETEDGANADVAGVANIVERIFKAGLLPEKAGIGVDAVGIAAILDELSLREIPDDCIAAVPQGYRLSGVIKGAARKLKDGTLKHGARPMMAWAVSNARSELRGSAVLVTKQASGTAKIDPLIGLFNAFDLMSRNPEAAGSRDLSDFLKNAVSA
ncbi:Phage terminase-like protein, large subunit, contains N-terminal HTH domain [Bosea lupini]|uniref:Phage terminase-like protein, large subunit, contains N-terminal HTH domain n=1 Tax=Bosea lupini TaxID=1036779 RepID=A0A1H8AFA2_9HYPH|nr:terminase large subunit [Bosea lupini]SEM69223.1 Phage terminase-like protein, large subunit, contains N-terminal HTH domain [Bosea lupini]